MNQENQKQNEQTNYQVRVEKKHNIFYRTTNQINWKYYFGIHSTNNLNDGYLGTGRLIKEAIKKYGKENFHLTIIADYPTRKEASEHEALAVTMIQAEDENCYNLKTGGDNENTHSKETRKRLSEVNSGKKLSKETKEKMSIFQKGRIKSEDHRKKISDGLILMYQNLPEKITRSVETKEKMSKSHSGEKNHWFGKFNNNPISKACKIFDMIYVSPTEAARQLNMSAGIVRYRLLSKSDKFKDWKYCE